MQAKVRKLVPFTQSLDRRLGSSGGDKIMCKIERHDFNSPCAFGALTTLSKRAYKAHFTRRTVEAA